MIRYLVWTRPPAHLSAQSSFLQNKPTRKPPSLYHAAA